jgi:hypothetical protein
MLSWIHRKRLLLAMNDHLAATAQWRDVLEGWYLRFAASGAIPARWYLPALPPEEERAATSGALELEIVSHCWRYARFLRFQLASLVRFRPARTAVTVTIFHAAEDDETCRLLETYGSKRVPGITWNWRALPEEQLFRRAIGRNLAALATRADWVWFTDCDVMFRDECLDVLGDRLQGRRDALVYPRQENVTPLLDSSDPMLAPTTDEQVPEVDVSRFMISERGRATGPLQIVHGDVARACGYCEALPHYQKPILKFAKCHEDRVFRWLLRTNGVAIDVPGVYRIRHAEKGRYSGSSLSGALHGLLRRRHSMHPERRPSW